VGTTPDQLRADIERTRSRLSYDVGTLTEKVSPGAAMQRSKSRARGRLAGLKDAVMGSAHDASASARGSARSASSSVSDRASAVADTAQQAPDDLRRATSGNPLAAGLIAFGAGLLVSSLLPATEAEQRAATGLRERAEPVIDEVKDRAKDEATQLKDELQPAAQGAADAVKETAAAGARDTAEETRGAARDVQGHAKTAAEDVRDTGAR
jgi:uncharacterized protein YjbJ (UPF0337 family)